MATNEEEKVFFHQDNVLCHKSIATIAKLHELHFKVTSETEVYFEAKYKLFSKYSIELLKKNWNQ